MSFSGLLDHTCRIQRRTETRGTRLETVVDYAVPEGYEDLPCTFTRRRTALVSNGTGLQPTGQRTVYLDRVDLTWQDRDVVQITGGPPGFQAMSLEVVSASVPRGHHVELVCQEYAGIIELEGS